MFNKFYKNPYFIIPMVVFILIILPLCIYFIIKSLNHSGKEINNNPDINPNTSLGMSLSGDNGKISSWAWNSRVTGGFMGYGIFANKTGGYTWTLDNNEMSNNATKSIKWDQQSQNTQAKDNTNDLDNIDSGSQFWDFISKKGSYQSTYKRPSLDGIKIQYDNISSSDMGMTEKYKKLLKNLSNEVSQLAILIGGKPTADMKAYHGVSYKDMKTQITNAVEWITDNKLGDIIYISLDIEPADSIIDSISLENDQNWYQTIFGDLAKFITNIGKSKPNVYFGMAINKNPYQSTTAYNAWNSLMKSNWKTSDNKERGFRVIELMYWWTYIDTIGNIANSHLVSQLKTKGEGVTSNPVKDAITNNCYLQFGMEVTGEVDYLIFVDKDSNFKQLECGTTTDPAPNTNCYKAQDGINYVDDGIGYRCESKLTKKDSFFNYDMNDDSDIYFSTMKKVGNKNQYDIVYGYPFIGYCGKSSHYLNIQCNALGGCKRGADEDADPIGTGGQHDTIQSAVNFKSCTYFNKETWLLGGGLIHQSLEQFLHSKDAVTYIKNAVNNVENNGDKRIFSIPFCVEDLTGYAGWLHNFKYGRNNNTSEQIKSLIDFPDKSIKPDNGEGIICRASINANKERNSGFKNGYDVNIACLGQTTMSVDENQKTITDWTAGTLNYDEETKQWSCPLDKYFHEDK